MKTNTIQSKNGHSVLVDFEEGFSTYRIAVPMPYAVRFFLNGLVTSLGILSQKREVQQKLESKQGHKSEIQENLRRAVELYDAYLKEVGR
ncbi:MAG: hypothetical protein ACTSUO_06295 [Candidatus Thorarchaeota archaeon]